MIVTPEGEFKKTKWDDDVSLKCDYCENVFNRSKRGTLKHKTNRHYCNTNCMGKHKSELRLEEVKDVTSKVCLVCGDDKPLSDFNVKNTNIDGHQSTCRICSNIHSKKYYSENSERMREQIITSNRKRRHERIETVCDYLLDHPCVDCGETNPIVLEFDHRDDVEKSHGISYMIGQGWGIESIMGEIGKCDVRCSNCHKIRTSKQQGWYILEYIDKFNNNDK